MQANHEQEEDEGPPVNKDDGKVRSVELFADAFIMESSSGFSSQGIVFFGREKTLGIRVVVKQFSGSKRRQIAHEIKVLSEFERFRQTNVGNQLVKALNSDNFLKGFPQLLGYKVSRDYSEIMMTHGGSSLDQWMNHFEGSSERTKFATEMLRQMILALETLH